MTDEAIRTVIDGGQAEFRIKGSRFIGYLYGVASPEAATATIDSISDEHPDATHIVWAYRLDGEPTKERSDDDGEPGGSAGKPALGVLQGEDLLDVVAVVVRYYGGTNLGYGGLVRAYSRGVKEGIQAAEIETRLPTTEIRLEVHYEDSGTVQGVLESENIAFDATYEELVCFNVEVPNQRLDSVVDRLRSATGDRARIEK